jgi:hypothetical protein
MWGWETTARKAKQLADGCSFSITLCCVNPEAAGVCKGSKGGLERMASGSPAAGPDAGGLRQALREGIAAPGGH